MNKIMSNKKNIIMFVLPAFALYFVFALVPIVYNFYFSLFKTDLMSPSRFVGLKNYTNMLHDRTFLLALRNNILMVIGSLIAHLPVAMFFATVLFNKFKGSKFFQSVFFMPSVICGVAIGMMWSFVYNGNFGLLNKLLEIIGREDLQTHWLANKNTALLAIIFVVMWQYVGYHMVIQLAAMKSIPKSFFEAARIDGANGWQKFRFITFPLIKPILKIDTVLIITGSLKYYDLIAVMTGGGPNHATETMSTYMYYLGFRTMKYGYSSTIGVILLVLSILAIVMSNLVFKSERIEF